ncbi:MAG: hypothetical protein O3C40_19355 [Planctomycetota bacterium]|nr:hypothetical protein [Planctomycetota bacterium]
MITRFSLFTAGIGTFAYATVVHAHPGHGEPGDDFSLMHYATEPLHLGVGFCLLLGAVVLVRLIRASYSHRKRQETAA